ncbi:CBS domain-containing protein [Robiginitalea sp.]|nr:CBS domain-containing protein [Robiginitalea sp.]
MQLSEYINTTIPVFEPEDSLKEVILFFAHSTHSHVAVAEEGKFLGLLGEDDLDSFQETSQIEAYRYQLETFFVRPEATWLDVLEAFARNDANIMPVVTDQGVLMGYYDLTDVVGIFRDMPFYTEPGIVLVVARSLRDYSFSELAQIVEGSNTRLLGAMITGMRNELAEITLKMGNTNVGEVLNALRRYGYTLLSGSADDPFIEELKERSHYLDKYLNV